MREATIAPGTQVIVDEIHKDDPHLKSQRLHIQQQMTIIKTKKHWGDGWFACYLKRQSDGQTVIYYKVKLQIL